MTRRSSKKKGKPTPKKSAKQSAVPAKRLLLHGFIVAVVLIGLLVIFWPEGDQEPAGDNGSPVANMTIPPPVAAIKREPLPSTEASSEAAVTSDTPANTPADTGGEPPAVPEVDNRDEQQAPSDLAPPDWQRYAVTPDHDGAAEPKIAIVLDDMGLNEKAARRVANLPGPLTLAFLPYARNLPDQTLNARLKGHELMVHMPMEPEGRGMDPGPDALLTGLDAAELKRRLNRNLGQFKGYVGFNNHMGSKFTTDSTGMTVVLAEAKVRGLLFLDSRTTDGTVSARIANELDLPYAARDVFLDNVRTDAAIRAQLSTLLTVARKRGGAIAIGHPYPETLSVLAAWLPDLDKHKVKLVPLSTLVTQQP